MFGQIACEVAFIHKSGARLYFGYRFLMLLSGAERWRPIAAGVINGFRYYLPMITHFKCAETEALTREVPWPHPGEILLEEWLKPLELSQYALAKAIDVPPRRINEIVKGLRGITADTALRLAAFFGTDAQSWLKLQSDYDITVARDAMADVLGRIQRYESTHS